MTISLADLGRLLPHAGRRRLRRLTGPTASRPGPSGGALSAAFDRRPKRFTAIAAASAAALAALVGGPMAAVVASVYAVVLSVEVRCRRRTVRRTAVTARALDDIAAYAADLRAGADLRATEGRRPADGLVGTPPALADGAEEVDRLRQRVSTARRVAEVTGAPLADLLDRLEADSRAIARVRANAIAQAAGAQATAYLLAALPAGGVALGFGIGVDSLHVLLHTRLGAVFTIVALGLQVGGLAWSSRLTATITRST
jgi:tight adherence protein B